mmetsp:Transcript_15209/g.45867  ORF Transcript_15209/g.45867 Transcript_15209/m.45867 type:complete len:825 (+) Transcript_15209:225-2699(+)|eukprot:CAMPEP_0206146024 /NCGR_PEP_ID=MMETSP1473-20131121/29270_1 /ASSEMBLY_ACC=CAM_ASM_001109 /TAXON_ID=1461547 /ORGANISM="Stichococcus sp, Strain RCC1054" /LENGTH=824 /DNA_ID=CAMNT_0053542449 /DNA_START=188 /DNA_END=2662 /DNA_ORIENTATION=+
MAATEPWRWRPPKGWSDNSSGLRLFSSYHNAVVPFVPAAGPDSRAVSWYACGPTVYEESHIGHARNYLAADIVRRVMEDYFGYRVRMVMNVTDVDDKIIIKARRAFLLQRYRDSKPTCDQVKECVQRALEAVRAREAAEVAELTAALEAPKLKDRDAVQGRLTRAQQALEDVQAKQQALSQRPAGENPADIAKLLDEHQAAMAEDLDANSGAQDVDITDHSIFQSHARRYETAFWRDMASLGVRMPEARPRVSEYIPDIVAYIERILDQGFAYSVDGSVYFDTRALEAAGHTYRKLSPAPPGGGSAVDPASAESEANFHSKAKRDPRDFALWKAAKAGEPSWPSTWGPGRPGWHIECSAMAGALIGGRMDIHSGGADLRFPHHDNELAQAEAYYHPQESASCDCHQWVNYFLHSGHLHIHGLKMSKSLKNFITIREALESFTPRQLRLMMCLQPWQNTLIYSNQSLEEVVTREKEFHNFFLNVQTAVRETSEAEAARTSPSDTTTRWLDEEKALDSKIEAAAAAVHDKLCDNVNTAGALQQLSQLMTHVNVYLTARPRPQGGPGGVLPQKELLNKAATFVTRILSVLGLVAPSWDRTTAFLDTSDASSSGASGEAEVPFINAFVRLREDGRRIAQSKEARSDPAAALQAILRLMDRARDEDAAVLGVRVEDKGDGASTWKREDPAVLARERQQAAHTAAASRANKLDKQLQAKEAELKKLADIARKPGLQAELADKFDPRGWSDWEGIPTHAVERREDGSLDAVELSDKARKKAQKTVENGRTAYKRLQTVQEAEGDDWEAKRKTDIDTARAELEALTAQLEKL